MADVTKSYVICTPGSGSGDTQLTLKAKTANLGNRLNQTDQLHNHRSRCFPQQAVHCNPSGCCRVHLVR